MDSSKSSNSTKDIKSSWNRKKSLSNSSENQPKRKTKSKSKQARKCLGENLLTLATLLSVVVGVALGLGLRIGKKWTQREVMYMNFPGELFLNILKCLILPLITSSLIAAVGSLDTKLTGKIGLRAVVYYVCTTIVAIVIGIVLVTTIRPGVGKKKQTEDKSAEDMVSNKSTLPEDGLMDLIRNIFPPNLIEAMLKTQFSVLEQPEGINVTENTTNDERRLWTHGLQMSNHINILGIVLISTVVGMTLAVMKEKGKPLLDIFVTLFDATMIIVQVVIWMTPIGVLFLVASKILEVDDIHQLLGQIGMFTVTVLVGLALHGFVVLPSIYYIITKKNPLVFFANMAQALATAFGTSSSSATLPVTITCLEDKNHVDPRVVRFCLPIGATINMDGAALYEAVTAIFIAQVRGIPLGFGKIIATSIAATAASIGAAGIPQAGAVTVIIVLNVVGLPSDDVSMILMVDWALDRFRTVINVFGDAIGSGIVEHLSRCDLAEIDEENPSSETTEL